MKRDGEEFNALRADGYRYLNRAIDEAGDQLRRDWWFARDPDLEVLRDETDPEWLLLERRFSGRPRRPYGLPESPWGRLLVGGEVVLGVLLFALGVAILVYAGLLTLIAAAAVVFVWGLASVASHLQHPRALRIDHRPEHSPRRRGRRARSGPDAQAAVDLRLGRRLRRAGDLVTAEGALRSAAARGRPDAALELGRLLEDRKELAGAADAYETALRGARRDENEVAVEAAEFGLARLRGKAR